MTIREMIAKHNMTYVAAKDGIYIPNPKKTKFTQKDAEFIKANRPAFIAELKAIAEEARIAAEEARKEEAEKKAAEITFLSTGWESHYITVDTRKDIDEQLRRMADRYSNDCTYESLKEDYEMATGKKLEKEAKAEAAKTEKEEKIEAAKAEAKATGEKVAIKRWTENCNDPKEDCETDIVTLWAMPDGTTKTTRTHTW